MANPASFLQGVLGEADAAATYEPQRQNNGLLRIDGLGGLLEGDSESITLALMNFPLPDVSVSVTEIPYLNERRRYAGNVNYGMMNVTFHDYVDRKIAMTMWKWHTYIHAPTSGTRGIKAQYAKSGWIDVFSPDGDSMNALTYKILNIWPVSINFGQVDMQTDEPVRIGVQFALDKIIPTDGSDDWGVNAAGANPSSL